MTRRCPGSGRRSATRRVRVAATLGAVQDAIAARHGRATKG